MEDAHLRMGILEYDRHTEKIATRIRVRVSHYVGENEDAHMISIFGNDSDVGAITAAVRAGRIQGHISDREQPGSNARRGSYLLSRQPQYSRSEKRGAPHDRAF